MSQAARRVAVTSMSRGGSRFDEKGLFAENNLWKQVYRTASFKLRLAGGLRSASDAFDASTDLAHARRRDAREEE
jgi:hypothetical protein